MRTKKCALVLALALFSLLAATTSRADTTYLITGTVSCVWSAMTPCPASTLSFDAGSTITFSPPFIDPISGPETIATANISIDGGEMLFTGWSDIELNSYNFIDTSYNPPPTGFLGAAELSLNLINPTGVFTNPASVSLIYAVPGPGSSSNDGWIEDGTYQLTAVPEPCTSELLGTAIVGMGMLRFWLRNRQRSGVSSSLSRS